MDELSKEIENEIMILSKELVILNNILIYFNNIVWMDYNRICDVQKFFSKLIYKKTIEIETLVQQIKDYEEVIKEKNNE